MSCGREEDCRTCYQGAEVLPDCTKQSILYENLCVKCTPEARSKKPLEVGELMRKGEHALSVGETGRSILERVLGRLKKDSYMSKHQDLVQ